MQAHAGGRLDAVVHCGPVALGVRADSAALYERALEELEQFRARWDEPCGVIGVQLHSVDEPAALGEGRFLHCSSLRVDVRSATLVATSRSGATGVSDSRRRQWDLYLPRRRAAAVEGTNEDNVEDLLELILTTAWREVGWIPLHAGAVVGARSCALLMAPARGGKSTLTTAMVHRGWRTLGDDKLLLALRADGQPEVRGLTAQFNLDPRTATWFPEFHHLESLPPLSNWTAKRRISIADVWNDRFAERARPTHVVRIRRVAERVPMRAEPLAASQVLSALLRQTVVPTDPATAKSILTVVARAAHALRGVCVEIGDDAYRDRSALDGLEALLQ